MHFPNHVNGSTTRIALAFFAGKHTEIRKQTIVFCCSLVSNEMVLGIFPFAPILEESIFVLPKARLFGGKKSPENWEKKLIVVLGSDGEME